MLENLPESVGHALINQRAGMESVVYNELHRLRSTHRLQLTSRAFAFNARLPQRFTADGDGVSPPLAWNDVPADVRSLALIVEDADSPTPHPLVHAIVVNLDASSDGLEEGALDSPDHAGTGPAAGRNSFLQHAWLPPDPPRGHGEHRYVFQLFGLGVDAPVDAGLGRGAFIELVLARAVAVGCLIGTYERSERVDADHPVEADAGLDPAGPVFA